MNHHHNSLRMMMNPLVHHFRRHYNGLVPPPRQWIITTWAPWLPVLVVGTIALVGYLSVLFHPVLLYTTLVWYRSYRQEELYRNFFCLKNNQNGNDNDNDNHNNGNNNNHHDSTAQLCPTVLACYAQPVPVQQQHEPLTSRVSRWFGRALESASCGCWRRRRRRQSQQPQSQQYPSHHWVGVLRLAYTIPSTRTRIVKEFQCPLLLLWPMANGNNHNNNNDNSLERYHVGDVLDEGAYCWNAQFPRSLLPRDSLEQYLDRALYTMRPPLQFRQHQSQQQHLQQQQQSQRQQSSSSSSWSGLWTWVLILSVVDRFRYRVTQWAALHPEWYNDDDDNHYQDDDSDDMDGPPSLAQRLLSQSQLPFLLQSTWTVVYNVVRLYAVLRVVAGHVVKSRRPPPPEYQVLQQGSGWVLGTQMKIISIDVDMTVTTPPPPPPTTTTTLGTETTVSTMTETTTTDTTVAAAAAASTTTTKGKSRTATTTSSNERGPSPPQFDWKMDEQGCQLSWWLLTTDTVVTANEGEEEGKKKKKNCNEREEEPETTFCNAALQIPPPSESDNEMMGDSSTYEESPGATAVPCDSNDKHDRESCHPPTDQQEAAKLPNSTRNMKRPSRARTNPSCLALAMLCIVLLLVPSTTAANAMLRRSETLKHDVECPEFCIEQQERAPSQEDRTARREEDEDLRIFYLILVHNRRTVQAAVPLFRAIRDPRNIVLIHVDTKARHLLDEPLLLWDEIEHCPCGSSVRVESVHAVEWGEWSMLKPTLWAMEIAVNEYRMSEESGQSWNVFINLAGDSLPVYAPDTTARILSKIVPHYNFVTSSSCETGLVPTNLYDFPKWWHKRAHYTRRETEPDWIWSNGTSDRTLSIHFGSQWVIVQAEFCRWLVEALMGEEGEEASESMPALLARELQQSKKLMTDETFLPTVLMHSDEFASTIPQVDDETGFLILPDDDVQHFLKAVRYERMDEHLPTSSGHLWKNQRYDVPPNQTSELIDVPRPWGPYYLGVYDLAHIRDSGALFIRKVSSHVDDNLLRLLPVDEPEEIPWITWPTHEITLAAKPDWKSKLSSLQQHADELKGSEAAPDDDEEL